jgi:hemoglobin
MQIFDDVFIKTPILYAPLVVFVAASAWALTSHWTRSKPKTVVAKKSLTIKDKLGGDAAIEAAVEEFYKRVPMDPKLAPFFAGFSMEHLKRHQRSFMNNAFTGNPGNLDLHNLMLTRHAKLFNERGLKAEHFDLVAGHLVATLEYLQVEPTVIGEAAAVVMSLRPAFEEGEQLAKFAKENEGVQA